VRLTRLARRGPPQRIFKVNRRLPLSMAAKAAKMQAAWRRVERSADRHGKNATRFAVWRLPSRVNSKSSLSWTLASQDSEPYRVTLSFTFEFLWSGSVWESS